MRYPWQKITLLYLIVVFFILIIALIGYEEHSTHYPPPTLATNLDIKPFFHFSITPIYLQNDPRWKDDKIGGIQETLGKVGCFVSCVSMALAHYGIDLTPKQLNKLLKANNGYTEQGWVKWYVVTKIVHNKIFFHVPNQIRSSIIDTALKAEEPILTKILLYNVIPHWVLIVGKVGQDYLVKDPLGDGKSLDKFTKFKSKIHAIRIIKKRE